jgi:hypothetical protein
MIEYYSGTKSGPEGLMTNNVYVSDRGNNNIQKFSPKVEP